jgi:predicted phage baseplate assembly protein
MTHTQDGRAFPPAADISPGLDTIPRQIGSFGELRAALLSALGADEHAIPFKQWTAREGTDLGLMLLELWAYLADILTFYDEVHAHEAYLGTARRRESLRKLVDLLGYRPSPAVAASVELALEAEGKLPVTVPKGTAFRTGEVDGGPPQIFELDGDETIHPLRNRWDVDAPRPTTLEGAGATAGSDAVLLFDPRRSGKIEVGDLLYVTTGSVGTAVVRSVSAVEEAKDGTGTAYRQVTLDGDLGSLPLSSALSDVQVYRPAQQTTPDTVDLTTSVQSQSIYLAGVVRALRSGQVVIVEVDGNRGAFVLTDVHEDRFTVTVSTSPETVTAMLSFTHIWVDSALTGSRGDSSFTNANRGKMTIHHGLVRVGSPTAMPADELGPGDAITLSGRVRTPREDPGGSRVALYDDDGQSLVIDASVDFDAATITSSDTRPTLVVPVQAMGNLVTATRGETVSSEVLGSGDGQTASQSFTLKKKPLTYVPDTGSGSGRASTLTLWVDGVEWDEVDSFYGASADDTVYIVRLDEDGEATITFGDGERGRRLPTGTNNVVASYRHGAGEAAPESGSIKQIARPAQGLKGVRQPEDGTPGSDAETAETIRSAAPRQATLLGRAVSLLDFQAVVAACNGVRATAVDWAWASRHQRAVVHVWHVGSNQSTVKDRLQGVSDPTTVFEVDEAQAVPIQLDLELEVHEDYVTSSVEAEVAAVLSDTETGLLPPERIGIGRPFFFSALRAKVHEVAGVVAVRIAWREVGGTQVTPTGGVSPGVGKYFDLVDDGIFTINGTTYDIA